MATELGRKLAGLDPVRIENPVLSALVREMQGGMCSRSGGFNDNGRIHTDYVNNDTDAHTDFAKESFCSSTRDDDHCDLSYRDGRRYSHSDETDCCDNHSDSDPNHSLRWSYSDMTR